MENILDDLHENQQKNLLEDDLIPMLDFEYAAQGQRFINFIVDNVLLRFTLTYATSYALGILLAMVAPDFIQAILLNEERMTWQLFLLSIAVGYVNYILYYTLCEKLFKGVTLGKLITRTRAVKDDGGELSFKDALYRSLSRCVPFEVFSGFAQAPWHDMWTDTMVIKNK